MFLPGDYSLDSYSVPSVWRYIYHSFIKLLKFLITCIIRLDEVEILLIVMKNCVIHFIVFGQKAKLERKLNGFCLHNVTS